MTDTTVLGGRYELGEVIGRGGMATVRRARDTRLGRDVAVKQLRVDLAGDPVFQARFRREAQSAAGLNHPTIVSVYDTGVTPDATTGVDIPYIVMELVEGQTLREVLRQGRRILPERALEITQGVLDALQYSHKAGIIHRDIKPANVMLTRSGAVKVMDFGIARAIADSSSTMTQTAAVIGTAQYLSPEQARGETVDARSDVYSAGCLLYELLTGRPPFVGDSPVSVAYQHVRETPLAPSRVDGQDTLISPQVDTVVLKSLGKTPDERYQSAKEMRDDIARVLAGQQPLGTAPVFATTGADAATEMMPAQTAALATTSPRTPTAPPVAVEPTEEPRQRKGMTVLLWLLALLAVAAIAFGTWAFLNRGPADVTVSSVKGYNQEAAQDTLTKAGLNVTIQHYAGPDDATVGKVTDQDPAAGTVVKEKSKVTIKINDGPKKGTVPNVVGLSLDEAKAALGKAGFTKVTSEVSTMESSKASGTVLDVTPNEGVIAESSTTIVLQVASGKRTIPNVTGRTAKEAADTLTGLGFRVNQNMIDSKSADQEGRVIAQTPLEGEREVGSSITISVGRKFVPPVATPTASISPEPTAPSVVDMTESEAVAALRAAGYQPLVLHAPAIDPAGIGKVLSQQPPRAGIVTILVGK